MSANRRLSMQRLLPGTDVLVDDENSWTKVALPFPELCGMCQDKYTHVGEKPPASFGWDPRVVVPGCLRCRAACHFNDKFDALQVVDGGLAAAQRRTRAAGGSAS